MKDGAIDNESGRRVARFTLIATLIMSVVANVAHAVLADSAITLWLRVPAAAVWPVLSFLAIEVIVKIVWRSTITHYLARVFILGPAVPAIIVSYEHQSKLLVLMGDKGIVSLIGPVAIDGLMIGCTLALLFTRATPALIAPAAPVEIEAYLPEVHELEPTPAVERAPRPVKVSGSLDAAIEALQSGQDAASAAKASGMSVQAVRRYAAIIRTLTADPTAPIDAKAKAVRADAVAAIRTWAATR